MVTHKALMHFLHRAPHWLTFISVWKREDRRQVGLRLPASAIDGFVRSCAAEKTWIWSQTAGREDGKGTWRRGQKTERWKKVEWNLKKKESRARDSTGWLRFLLRTGGGATDSEGDMPRLHTRQEELLRNEDWRREERVLLFKIHWAAIRCRNRGQSLHWKTGGLGFVPADDCVRCSVVLGHCGLASNDGLHTVSSNIVLLPGWFNEVKTRWARLGRNSGVTPISQRASPLGQPESWLIYIHLQLYNTHMSNQQLKVQNGHEW